MTIWSFFRALWAGSPWLLALSTAAAIGQALLALPLAWLLQDLFVTDGAPADIWQLAFSAIALVAVYLAGDLLLLLSARINLLKTKDAIYRTRIKLVETLYDGDRLRDHEAETGRLHDLIVHDAERLDEMTNGLSAKLLPSALAAIILVVVMAILDWRLCLVAMIALPVALLISRLARRMLVGNIDRFHASFAAFSKGVQDSLRRLRLSHLHGAMANDAATLRAQADDLKQAGSKVAWTAQVVNTGQVQLTFIVAILVLVAGRMLIEQGLTDFATLIAFYVVMGMLRARANVITAEIPHVVAGKAALDRISKQLACLPQDGADGGTAPDQLGTIRVEGARFSYGGRPVLEDQHLTVTPGTLTVLSGPNGVGKTTLADIVAGLTRPEAGSVQADGTDYGQLDREALRSRMGYALQDPHIIEHSIAANLTYGLGRDGFSDEDLARVLDLVGLETLARDHPDGLAAGLERELGQMGSKLSGGQRQRISLARALLRDPELLIVDEPTNHLGAQQARTLIERIRTERPDMAILLITHDQALIALADHHVQLG